MTPSPDTPSSRVEFGARRGALALLATVAIAACEPARPLMTDAPALPVVAGCTAETHGVWTAPGGETFTYDAMTRGPDCGRAVAFLVVRTEAGEPDVTWASPVANIFGLHEAPDAAAMTTALADWLSQTDGWPGTTGALPEWQAGEELPGGEFPFHPEDWHDRDTYAALRTENAPVFAFAQGRESLAVYALRQGHLEVIGVQQFPG